MAQAEYKRFEQPDERRPFPNGHAEIVRIGGGEVGRFIFYPGWRWSNDVKPIAQTNSCEAPHFQYHVSGHLAIRMDDGSEFVAGPGDVTALPSGHDAWVVGDQPAVVVDWFGASIYAREPAAVPARPKAGKAKPAKKKPAKKAKPAKAKKPAAAKKGKKQKKRK
jgi:hypothetical protein